MEQKEKSKNAKRRKFKQTKQLVNLALNDGWTQQEIANLCRVHQSIVSDWKRGSKQGTEDQLKDLLEQFGHKLRRNSFKLYREQPDSESPPRFFIVEGKVILSQSFTDRRSSGGKFGKKIPLLKLVVHHQGKGLFRVVQQLRIKSLGSVGEVDNSQEDAFLHSEVSEPLDSLRLIEFTEKYGEDSLKHWAPNDALTLPFLIRKALLNHGHTIDDIENYPASW